MIDRNLTHADTGRWCEYTNADGKIIMGRLKGYNNADRTALLVSKAGGHLREPDAWKAYSGEKVSYNNIQFLTSIKR